MALGANRPKPGLKAIYDAREGRQGGGKYGRPSTVVYLGGVGAILASLVAYHYVSEHDFEGKKRDVLSQQHALKATIGAEWFPLRDEVEKYTLNAAGAYQGDFVDSEATRWDLRSTPGLYLRMRVSDVKDIASLRDAAAFSQRDQFVGCFLREQNAAAAHGEPDAGAFPEQPWNLGRAYTATRVLGDDWVDGLKAADDKMQLRVFSEQIEKAAQVDMKTAAQVVKQARFFLLVLDEDSPDAKPAGDSGVIDEAALQLVPHWSRVHILDLRTKSELVRLRREGAASFVFAGEHATTDDETHDALQRQVNNCALANQVRAAIQSKGTDAAAP